MNPFKNISECACRIGKVYPKDCEDKTTVCDPEATSFGDVCRVEGCVKVS